jgi:hypothetical protein
MYVSLCLIAKDENSYLKEWLDYHILMGVQHFWIYDNDSAVPLAESIQYYIKKGWVTLNAIHGKGMQIHAYDHCLQTYGSLSKWIGFIDTDEFINPKTGVTIPEFLKPFEKYGGLAVNDLFFGSNGQQERPKCGQVAGYTMRTPADLARNRLIKSIVQPSRVLYPISPHSFLYSEGYYCVNEQENRVDSQFYICSVDKIQINHYYTRSAQELKKKIDRGRGDAGDKWPDQIWVDINNNSTVNDYSALDLAVNLMKLPPGLLKNRTALTDPLSTTFLDALSKAEQTIQPSECQAESVSNIKPREEYQALIKDWTDWKNFLSNGNIQEIRKLHSKFIQKFPFDLSQYTNYAIACLQMHDLPSAWEALAFAWKMSPRNWTVLSVMIDYFYSMGNFEQVEKCSLLLNEYGNLEPIHVAGLAIAQWKQGKQELARETARQIMPQLTADWAGGHPWYKELSEIMKPSGQQNNG